MARILFSWLIAVSLFPPFSLGDEETRQAFKPHNRDNDAGLQVLMGVGDFVLGVAGINLGAQLLFPTATHYEQVALLWDNVGQMRSRIASDPRLREMLQLEKTINLLSMAGSLCAPRIASLAEQYADLAHSPLPPGTRQTEDWQASLNAAQRAFQKTVAEFALKRGTGVFLLTAGGSFLVQIGTRIWLYNHNGIDPAVFPHSVIAYEYGVRRAFKLVGYLDELDRFFEGEAELGGHSFYRHGY